VPSIDPLAIDFSPQVGYKLNRKFVIGIGGTYRQSFGDSVPSLAPTVFGYKAFSSYEVVSSFFAYTEYDRNSPGIKKEEGKSVRMWNDALFLGAGRKFTVHPKIEMTLIIAYNFLHQLSDPIYPKPWMVKVGFQTSELAMLKNRRGK